MVTFFLKTKQSNILIFFQAQMVACLFPSILKRSSIIKRGQW